LVGEPLREEAKYEGYASIRRYEFDVIARTSLNGFKTCALVGLCGCDVLFVRLTDQKADSRDIHIDCTDLIHFHIEFILRNLL
jgi:hypothetical protein